jgi:hypothetical protein
VVRGWHVFEPSLQLHRPFQRDCDAACRRGVVVFSAPALVNECHISTTSS